MSAQPRFEKLYRAYVAVVIPPVRDGTYIVTYHARRWPELAVDAGAAAAALNACAEPEEP